MGGKDGRPKARAWDGDIAAEGMMRQFQSHPVGNYNPMRAKKAVSGYGWVASWDGPPSWGFALGAVPK